MIIRSRRLRAAAAFAWLVPALVLGLLHMTLPRPDAAVTRVGTPVWVADGYEVGVQPDVTASISRVEQAQGTVARDAILGAGLARAAFAESGQQLSWVDNTGFELDVDRNLKADTWSRPARAFQSTDVKRSGEHSLMLNSVAHREFRVWQSIHNVYAGQTYDVAGWANIPATDDAFTLELGVAWKDANGKELRVDSIKSWNAATDGWNEGATSLVAPEGTNSATFRITTSDLGTTLYVDDVVFQAR